MSIDLGELNWSAARYSGRGNRGKDARAVVSISLTGPLRH